MIAFFDTSSLVILYVEEPESEQVRDLTSACDAVLVCRIAYPEIRSALARRKQSGSISIHQNQRVIKALKEDWPAWVRLDFDDLLAGELAEKHLLRGMDAVHLASILPIVRRSPDTTVLFSCFDQRLRKAAEKEGRDLSDAQRRTTGPGAWAAKGSSAANRP